jgi:SlyX protein
MDEIEERLAHLIRQGDELSDIVAAQSRRIETLERRVALLLDRERGREAAGGGVYLGDEKPPHY